MAEPSEQGRTLRRNVLSHEHKRIITAAQRDMERARSHYDNVLVLLDGHTVWERSDGDICDFDGEDWPCNTFDALAFMYDVRAGERAGRTRNTHTIDKATLPVVNGPSGVAS